MSYTTTKTHTSSMRKVGYDSVLIDTMQEYEALYKALKQEELNSALNPLEYMDE